MKKEHKILIGLGLGYLLYFGPHMQPEYPIELIILFNQIDSDVDGMISKKEFQEYCEAIDFEYAEITNEFPDEIISLDQFINIMVYLEGVYNGIIESLIKE